MQNKICPLLSITGGLPTECKGDCCAWWDYLARACCLTSAADYTRAISDSLDSLTAESEDVND